MGRGRPPGVKNGQGSTQLAPIANWSPKHEIVVQLHIAGWDNKKIAQEVDLTPTRVSQILQDPQAKELKNEAIRRIREESIDSVEDGLSELAVRSVERLAETINNQFVPGTDAKKHQDNVALKLTRGFFPEGDEKEDTRAGEGIPVKLVDRLVTALENSNEAKELNQVEEAEYELVEG